MDGGAPLDDQGPSGAAASRPPRPFDPDPGPGRAPEAGTPARATGNTRQDLAGGQRPAEGTPPDAINPPGDPTMAYQDLIRRDLARLGCPEIDPRHIEASMRCVYGTLDHLGGPGWTRAVREAAAEVLAMGPTTAEALAESWGLWPTGKEDPR